MVTEGRRSKGSGGPDEDDEDLVVFVLCFQLRRRPQVLKFVFFYVRLW